MKTAKRKKRTKGERAIANAARLAKLLVAAPSEGDGVFAPPKFIADKRLAPALAFWREHAPQFVKLGTLEQPDRFAFAMLAIFAAEFVAAEDDILARGYSVNVRTVSGGLMPRESPSVGRRDFAAKMILELSRSFGLTKLDRLNLGRLERYNTASTDHFAKLNIHRDNNAQDEAAPIDDEAKKLRELLATRSLN
jgi:phage terminase small subunit